MLKKVSFVLLAIIMLMLLSCCNNTKVDMNDYKPSGNFSPLNMGGRIFTNGTIEQEGLSERDAVYSVKGTSKSEFVVVRARPPFPFMGSTQYELWQHKSMPLIPDDVFKIKDVFLFNDMDTSSISSRKGHFTIYPKEILSNEQTLGIMQDLSQEALSLEDITWNTSIKYTIIDIGMRFKNYPSIYWQAEIIECDGIMYYTIIDTQDGKTNLLYYKVNDALVSYMREVLADYNYYHH